MRMKRILALPMLAALLAASVCGTPASAKNSGNHSGDGSAVSKSEAAGKSLGVAFLSANYTTLNGSSQGAGLITVQRVNPGSYLARFTRSVKDCAYVATLDVYAKLSVTNFKILDNVLHVAIQNQSGKNVDKNFDLLVYCWK